MCNSGEKAEKGVHQKPALLQQSATEQKFQWNTMQDNKIITRTTSSATEMRLLVWNIAFIAFY